jgi:hypothetical protein
VIAVLPALWLAALGASGAESAPDRIPTASIALPQFEIVYTADASNAAHLLSRAIGDERAALATRVGEDYPGRTTVYVGRGAAELKALAGPGLNPPPWASGMAVPQRNLLLFDSTALLSDDARHLVRHELAHLSLAAGGGTWPRWFQEGFAMAHAGEWSLGQYAAMYRAVARGAAIPLRNLSDEWPDRAMEREVAYAESAAFVQFLGSTDDGAALRALIRTVRGGASFDSAFVSAFGRPLEDEESAWRASARQRYTWVPLLTGTGTLWGAITVLFLVAYARVRRRRSARLATLAAQEKALEAAQRIARAEARNVEDAPESPDKGRWLH